jgi:hypothetical protein
MSQTLVAMVASVAMFSVMYVLRKKEQLSVMHGWMYALWNY